MCDLLRERRRPDLNVPSNYLGALLRRVSEMFLHRQVIDTRFRIRQQCRHTNRWNLVAEFLPSHSPTA